MVGMFDNIVVPTFPVDHPPFFLCIQMEFDPNESDLDMRVLAVLIDDDGTLSVTYSIQAPGQYVLRVVNDAGETLASAQFLGMQ
mgnify:CR=1 FL=1